MKLKAIMTGAVMSVSVLAAVQLSAQGGNYSLDVKMKNIPDSVVFTLGCNDNTAYKLKKHIIGDSLHFELDIQEDYPMEFYVTARNPKDKNDRFIQGFYAGKGVKQKMTARNEGFFTTAALAGAPWDAVTEQWEEYSLAHMDKAKALQELRRACFPKDPTVNGPVALDSLTDARVGELTAELAALNKEYDGRMRKWVLANPDVPEAVNMMSWRYRQFSHEELEAFVAAIPAGLAGMPAVDNVVKIASVKMIAPGASMDDYEIKGEDVNGNAVKLSQFTTPYVLVDFNSLGCGACRMAAKHEIPKIIEKYGDKLTFVSFSVDDSRKRMERAHELDKATWTTIWDGQGSTGDVCVAYGVTSYPTFFLFGPDRTMLERREGWGNGMLERWLEKYIKE